LISVADIRFTIFSPPDIAPKTIRQPATVGWHANRSITCDARRVRDVAKGTPRVTFVNQRWRAGAGVAVALAAAASMSVRRPRTRHLAFVNGNREGVARSSLLSA